MAKLLPQVNDLPHKQWQSLDIICTMVPMHVTRKAIIAQMRTTITFLQTLLRKHRSVPIIMLSLCIVGFLSGFFLPNEIKLDQLQSILERYSEINNSSQPQFLALFLNNITVALLSLIFGFIIITPVITAYITGFIMGIFLDLTLRLSIISGKNLLPTAIVGILPHGILEIPAALLSTMLAIYWGVKLYAPKSFLPSMNRRMFFKNILFSFIIFCVPMLFVAAVIEATITPVLITATTRTLDLSTDLPPVADACFANATDINQLNTTVTSVTNDTSEAFGTTESLGTLLYDDVTFATLQQIKPQAATTKEYHLSNGKKLTISLVKMASKADAKKEVDLYYHILRIAQKGHPETKIQRLHDRILITQDSHTTLEAFNSVGYYVSITRLSEKNNDFFGRVLALQSDTIQRCQ